MSRAGSLERLIGQVLAARYRIGPRLGSGAMGTVFRAEHVKVGRKLAVKVLHPQMLANEKYRRRFDREAELAGQMHHPNVAGVIDVGITPEGLRYLVMEFADGPTLAELIKAGPMPGPRVVNLVKQLCDGLHHAHEHDLVHRDFKPDNVIVERDAYGAETPRILDFGIAIALADFSASERERLTTQGMVLGTPHYMAPEHASGQPIDHRIDLFALGVMSYEMLAGAMPFEGNGVEVARSYLSRAIPPMSQRAPKVQVDPLLEAFTRALLARERAERVPSAKAARELLELLEEDRAAAAKQLGVRLLEPRRTLPVASPPPPGRPGRTRPPLPSAWTNLPTEKMASAADGWSTAPMDRAGPEIPPAQDRAAPAHASASSAAVPIAVAAAPTSPAVQLELRDTELDVKLSAPPRQPPVAVPLSMPLPTHLTADEPALRPPSRGRRLWIAAALTVSLCVIGFLALRGGKKPARPEIAAIVPAARARPPVAGPAETLALALEPAPESNRPPVVLPPPEPAPAAASQPSLPPAPAQPAQAAEVVRPAIAPAATAPIGAPPPTAPATPPPAAPAIAPTSSADPSTARVAELYGEIGRALKRLDELHGQQATYDLWPRFRRIRILDALRSRDTRIEAHTDLLHLEREIDQRTR